MNDPLRLLLIGRRFWPHGGFDSAVFLLNLATALQRQGVRLSVWTPRYASSWPTELDVREIPVHRPAVAPRSDWSTSRYLRQLGSWLRDHGHHYDVLMVDSMREEAAAVVEAGKKLNRPVVVRSAGWGTASDPHWWTTSRSARRCGALAAMADAILVTGQTNHRNLLIEGVDADSIHRIDHGWFGQTVSSGHQAPTDPGNDSQRHQARWALGVANSDLKTQADTPVLLCCAQMERDSGIGLLVKSARRMVSRIPDLRLWLIGDGSRRDWIFESLRSEGLRASIAMPGSFADPSDLFTAADLFVQLDDHGLDAMLPAAIHADLPVVAIQSEAIRESVVGNDTSVLETLGAIEFVAPGTPKALSESVIRTFQELPQRRQRAGQLRRWLARTYPDDRVLNDYINIFRGLCRKPSSSPPRSVIGVGQ